VAQAEAAQGPSSRGSSNARRPALRATRLIRRPPRRPVMLDGVIVRVPRAALRPPIRRTWVAPASSGTVPETSTPGA
jgi:hypothetical protein